MQLKIYQVLENMSRQLIDSRVGSLEELPSDEDLARFEIIMLRYKDDLKGEIFTVFSEFLKGQENIVYRDTFMYIEDIDAQSVTKCVFVFDIFIEGNRVALKVDCLAYHNSVRCSIYSNDISSLEIGRCALSKPIELLLQGFPDGRTIELSYLLTKA